MTLADMQWKRASLHRVVLAWLRAERKEVAERLAQLHPSLWRPAGFPALLDNADVENTQENRDRLRLLYLIRNVFIVELPPDTVWYQVRNLRHEHLSQLRAVNEANWIDPADQNELFKVASRKKLKYEQPWQEWDSPILWGHDRNGPFTIIEGNHRLTAYTACGQNDLNIPIFVGLSRMKCIWHPPDIDSGQLMQDIFFLLQNVIESLRQENASLKKNVKD